MKHCLVFASLISPSKMTCLKHLEVRQTYSAARRIFSSLLGVSSGDETLHLMFDILRQRANILAGSCYPQQELHLPSLSCLSRVSTSGVVAELGCTCTLVSIFS